MCDKKAAYESLIIDGLVCAIQSHPQQLLWVTQLYTEISVHCPVSQAMISLPAMKAQHRKRSLAIVVIPTVSSMDQAITLVTQTGLWRLPDMSTP